MHMPHAGLVEVEQVEEEELAAEKENAKPFLAGAVAKKQPKTLLDYGCTRSEVRAGVNWGTSEIVPGRDVPPLLPMAPFHKALLMHVMQPLIPTNPRLPPHPGPRTLVQVRAVPIDV